MISVFSWLREHVKQAFVAGIQDGLDEIGSPDPDARGSLATLRARAAIAAKPSDDAEPSGTDADAEAPDKPRGRRAK